jgi:hypothetical protein
MHSKRGFTLIKLPSNTACDTNPSTETNVFIMSWYSHEVLGDMAPVDLYVLAAVVIDGVAATNLYNDIYSKDQTNVKYIAYSNYEFKNINAQAMCDDQFAVTYSSRKEDGRPHTSSGIFKYTGQQWTDIRDWP